MAVVKVCKGGRSLGQAIKYAAKMEITHGKDCADDPKVALDQMQTTKQIWDQLDGRQYKHYVISFAPGEVTTEQAFAVADKFMEKNFSGHESFSGIHTDKDHLHVHIVVNSVNFENGSKIHLDKSDLERFKSVSDDLCRENGLSVIDRTQSPKLDSARIYNMAEYQLNKKGESHASKISKSIMVVLEESRGQGNDVFKANLKQHGIIIDFNRSKTEVTFTDQHGKKSRGSTLAKKYGNPSFTRENIEKILQAKEIEKPSIEQPLHITKYKEYASQGMNDSLIVQKMLVDKFSNKDIADAIFKTSPKAPSRSDESRQYTKNLINKAEKTIKGITKTVGGGMAMGGGGSRRNIERSKTNSRPVSGGGLSVARGKSDDDRIAELVEKGMDQERATQMVLASEE